MAVTAGMVCHSVFEEQLLQAQLASVAVKRVHVERIWKHVLQQRDAQADEVPGLPSAAYPLLRSHFKGLTSTLSSQRTSNDGSTTKLLICLQSGQHVEAVLMRHDASAGKYAGGPAPRGIRSTLCVSSQVGCKMTCSFCATGTMGFKGNLSAGEIVEQLVHASRITPVRNIVFMGMGEPLNNYAAVVQAIKTVTGGSCFGLSQNHITVSTVGVIPKILSLADDLPGVNLAVSLHAATQELRCQIVPTARAYPLDKLMYAIHSYQVARSVLIEYIMLADINDTEAHAHQLGALLQNLKVVVNLIPYNPVTVISVAYRRSSDDSVYRFQKIVRENYGLRTTVRQEMGQDIAGACGQLVISQRVKQPVGSCTDIEELF